MAKIRIIENTSEITAGTRGASLGIDAVKIASLNKNSDFFKKHFENTIRILDANHLLFKETPYSYGKRINGLLEVFENVSEEVESTLKKGDYPLVLAADHGSAGGTIAGIKMAYPNKRLGVIWIDAHGDLHSPYTSPTGNMHGMPLATALALDNKECQVNEPIEETKEYWEKLKNVGGISPKINPVDLAFVGLRDTEAPEDDYMKRNGIPNILSEEVRKIGAEDTTKKLLDHVKDCDIIYVSFDVDSMDCDVVSKGTGTPVPNGILPEEAKVMLDTLAQNEKVVCMEVVEVNPCLDDKVNTMAETAFDLIESFTPHIENRI